MKWIGDKISYEKHADFLTIIITGKTESWKANLILVWIVAWLGAGVSILYSSIYTDSFEGQKWYAYTFFAFWFYFFYKIVRVYLWRKFGMEYIKIDADRFSFKRSIFSYGKAHEVLTENIKKFKIEDFSKKSYAKTFNDSFWVLGQGVITLDTIDNELNFGSQLSKDEAKKLVTTITKFLTKLKSIQ